MIIRLRENTIKRIESGRPSVQPEEIVHDMREEIEQLRKQIEHHPDVVRFKMELDLCRGELISCFNDRLALVVCKDLQQSVLLLPYY